MLYHALCVLYLGCDSVYVVSLPSPQSKRERRQQLGPVLSPEDNVLAKDVPLVHYSPKLHITGFCVTMWP